MIRSIRNHLDWIIVSLVMIVTAFNSHGYYHADEHFQIIEPAMYLLSELSFDQLTWEFESQIRPSIQPLIFAGFIALGRVLELDAFSIATISRLATALFVLMLFYFLRKKRGEGILWLLLIWFVPTLLCRFSSENWSGLLFVSALLIPKNRRYSGWIIGLVFGLSFAFRFQAAILIAPVLALWIYKKTFRPPAVIHILLGGLISLVILVLSDYILYQNWVFTPFNYFKVNLIDGVAGSRFGVSGPLFYLERVLSDALIIPSLMLLIGIVLYARKRPLDEFSVALFCFLLVHQIIGHKEVRFLFPLLIPSLIMLYAMMLEHRRLRQVARAAIVLFLPLTFWMSQRYMKPEIGCLKIANELGTDVYFTKTNPANPFGAPLHFYLPKGVQFISYSDSTVRPILVYSDRRAMKELDYFVYYQTIPDWIMLRTDYFGWQDRTTVTGVYRVE